MTANFLLGCALATSVKTPFLAAALALGILGSRWAARSWSGLRFEFSPGALRTGAAALGAACLVPLAVFGWLYRQGATAAFRHCLFEVNQAAMPDPQRAWAFVLGFPVALWACRKIVTSQDEGRAALFLTTAALVLLILGFSPSLLGQTFLAVYPLISLCLVGWLREWAGGWRGFRYPLLRTLACVALTCGLTAHLVIRARPWADGLGSQRALLQDTLRLTAQGDFVLDSKGETIFRRQPFYYAYVDVTRALLASGALKDKAIEGLLATDTRVVLGDLSRFPEPTRSYLRRRYAPLGKGWLRGWVRP